MFDNLLETNVRKQRSAGGALMSLLLHSGLIGLAVVATANAGDGVRVEEEPEKVAFVETPRPDEPPPPDPVPEPAVPPPEVATAPLPPKGFQVAQPPMNVPDVIPEIDLSKNGIDEADFTGIGVPGGRGHDVVGAAPRRVVDVGATYQPSEVDRAVAQLPGRGSPHYPGLLRSQGVKGRVVARFVVDTTGHVDVSSFEVLESSHDLFTDAVRRALPDMRFIPAEVAGRRVRQLVQQPFVFDMR